MTPLMLAASHGHVELVRALLQAGANAWATNRLHAGADALHYAVVALPESAWLLLGEAGKGRALSVAQALRALAMRGVTPVTLRAAREQALFRPAPISDQIL
jgi:hypothetical protein